MPKLTNKKILKLLPEILLFFLIVVLLFIENTPLLFFKNIRFHTDIARDFCLMQEIVQTKKPILTGGRVGGFSGLFHGPGWLYLNLPVFYLSQGNPISVNYYILCLILLSIISVYLIVKRRSCFWSAFLATTLYTISLKAWSGNFFQPLGAVLIAPAFFYFFSQITVDPNWRNIFLAGFTASLFSQFQLGFAIPAIIITTGKIIVLTTKKKISLKFLLLFFLALTLPLITFIAFDFRHNFLQTKTVFSHLRQSSNGIGWKNFIANRAQALLQITSQAVLPLSSIWAGLITVSLFAISFKHRHNKLIKNFLLILGGFLFLSVLNRGRLQGYHYWPLIPMAIISFCSLANLSKKTVWLIIAIALLLNNQFFIKNISNIFQNPQKLHLPADDWQFLNKTSRKIYEESPEDFGYFTYSPDQFSYSLRFAMAYQNQFFPVNGHAFEKLPSTYLLYAPSPDGKPWLDGSWWKNDQVNIKKRPDKKIYWSNGFRFEKYALTKRETKTPASSLLIKDNRFH